VEGWAQKLFLHRRKPPSGGAFDTRCFAPFFLQLAHLAAKSFVISSASPQVRKTLRVQVGHA
jgi:hypothetical protein